MIPDALLFQVVPHLRFIDPLWLQKVGLSALGALVLTAGIVFYRYYRTKKNHIPINIPRDHTPFIFPSQDDPELLIRTIHFIRWFLAKKYSNTTYLYFSLAELWMAIPNDDLLTDLALLESWYYQGKPMDQAMRESVFNMLSGIQKTSEQYM